jgi:IS5 family transposase
MRKISPIAAIATAVWWIRAKNRTKSEVRARVEHSIGVIKRVFGFAKVTKNIHRLLVTCALANLFMARRYLLRCNVA